MHNETYKIDTDTLDVYFEGNIWKLLPPKTSAADLIFTFGRDSRDENKLSPLAQVSLSLTVIRTCDTEGLVATASTTTLADGSSIPSSFDYYVG